MKTTICALSRKNSVLLLLFTLITFHISAQEQKNGPELYDISSCDQLLTLAKNKSERKELQKNYWIMLGVLSDLSRYRDQFLRNQNSIDLFPTAYYHTTQSELQEIVAGKINYPVEQMKLMIAFYSAYKRNRQLWDKGQKNSVESHWKNHFSLCQEEGKNYTCFSTGFILTTAVIAHVKYDLPRSIKWAYDNRFDKSMTSKNTKYFKDFFYANILFQKTTKLMESDISKVTGCIDWVLRNKEILDGVANELSESEKKILTSFGIQKILFDEDVVNLRAQSWKEAFSGLPFKGIDGEKLISQPVINQLDNLRTGMNICPDNDMFFPEAGVVSSVHQPVKKDKEPIKEVATDLYGGETPEALGIVMLKAIVTNDRKLWAKCIHPISDVSTVLESFDLVRTGLEEAGLTQWNSVVFSRVTFTINPSSFSSKDNGIYQGEGEFKGEQVRRNFEVEFTYKNKEFVGWLGNISIMSFKRRNYLMANPSEASLKRL